MKTKNNNLTTLEEFKENKFRYHYIRDGSGLEGFFILMEEEVKSGPTHRTAKKDFRLRRPIRQKVTWNFL